MMRVIHQTRNTLHLRCQSFIFISLARHMNTYAKHISQLQLIIPPNYKKRSSPYDLAAANFSPYVRWTLTVFNIFTISLHWDFRNSKTINLTLTLYWHHVGIMAKIPNKVWPLHFSRISSNKTWLQRATITTKSLDVMTTKSYNNTMTKTYLL